MSFFTCTFKNMIAKYIHEDTPKMSMQCNTHRREFHSPDHPLTFNINLLLKFSLALENPSCVRKNVFELIFGLKTCTKSHFIMRKSLSPFHITMYRIFYVCSRYISVNHINDYVLTRCTLQRKRDCGWVVCYGKPKEEILKNKMKNGSSNKSPKGQRHTQKSKPKYLFIEYTKR